MKVRYLLLVLLIGFVAACGPTAATPASTPSSRAAPTTAPASTLGTDANPIKMVMIPFVDANQLVKDMTPFVDLVAKEAGYKIKFDVTTSYGPAIEGMGAGKVDVAWYGPLQYVLAHDKYGADVMLVSQQKGSTQYRGAFFVRTDSPYKKLEDVKGKRVAFTDSASTSGYLYPNALIKSRGLDPKNFFSDVIFAGGHDKSLIALYKGEVDVAAAFETAREERVKQTLPDILEKTRVLEYTDWIPNDNVAVGKHVPKDVVEKLKAALMKVTSTPEGSAALVKAIGTEKLLPIEDKAYDPIRVAAQALDIDLSSKVK